MVVDLRFLSGGIANECVELPNGVRSPLALYIGRAVSPTCMECVYIEDPRNPVCPGSAYYLDDPKTRESDYSSVNIPQACPALDKLFLTRCALGELAMNRSEGDDLSAEVGDSVKALLDEKLEQGFKTMQDRIDFAAEQFDSELNEVAETLKLSAVVD